MKVALYEEAGRFAVREVPAPEPGPGQVALRIAYCGLCGTDKHIFHGKMDTRLSPPQPIGHEVSGVIESLGEGVEGFRPGDPVTVRPLAYDDDGSAWTRSGAHIRPGLKFMGIDTPGAMQEIWTVPAETLHRLPDGAPLDVAALTEPLAVACHDVRLGEVTRGELAVVLGGGPIGLLIALVARSEGARVIVSELNPHRLTLLDEMGFETVDPTTDDLAERVHERSGGLGADVVFEVTGSPAGAQAMTALPGVRSRIVVVSIYAEPVPIDLFQFFWKELRLCGARVYEAEDFEKAIALEASGTLPLDRLVSRVVPLENVQQAFEELDSGSDLMKVLIRCNPQAQ
jgi:2-desacetyl-2-hydroxyethyl bacteriochlorophyllide A dehydrogenase